MNVYAMQIGMDKAVSIIHKAVLTYVIYALVL
jgi:hypothetical protein